MTARYVTSFVVDINQSEGSYLLQAVADLLHYIRADPEDMYDLPNWHYESKEQPPGSKISLRGMLTHCYDLRSILISNHLCYPTMTL